LRVAAPRSLENAGVRPNAGRHALEGQTVATFAGAGQEVLAFGPFRLDPVRHVLREAGKPIQLGSRALGILLALVERAGETVSKNELLERVWKNCVVEDGTLRVHIATLRKILGEGESGGVYVENVSGQGYRFAAPVTCLRERPESGTAPPRGCRFAANPARRRTASTIYPRR
jgi:DNA-binding winged helix-turn-helix (wHTH) protein